jgi:DNA-binding MarR family transcriptional regulator
MPNDRVPEDEVLRRLGIPPSILAQCRERGYEALKRVFGGERTTIDFRPRSDRQPGFEYSPRDVDLLQHALKPLKPFTGPPGPDGQPMVWLPIRFVRTTYVWHRNLDAWEKKGRCPLLCGGKKPTSKEFLVYADDNVGLKYIRFYLKGELDEIDNRLAGLEIEPNPDLLTIPEAVKVCKVSRWRIFELLKNRKIYAYNGVRVVRRKRGGGVEKVPTSKRLVSKEEIAQAMADHNPEGEDGTLVTVSEAYKLSNKAFPIATMASWEKKDGKEGPSCPHIRQPLTVVYRRARIRQVKKGRVVYYVRELRHYLLDEIRRAYRNYRRAQRTPPKNRKSLKGIIQKNGGTYLTSRAAFREHGVGNKCLENWFGRRWIDSFKEERCGYGKYPETTYFREDGQRGFLHLMSLRGPNGRIPPDVAAELDAAAAAKVKQQESELAAPLNVGSLVINQADRVITSRADQVITSQADQVITSTSRYACVGTAANADILSPGQPPVFPIPTGDWPLSPIVPPGQGITAEDQQPGCAALRPLEVEILAVLAESEHVLMCQEDIAAAVHRTRTAIVQPLANLRSAGLVQRPRGERAGEAITDKGKRVFADVVSKKVAQAGVQDRA